MKTQRSVRKKVCVLASGGIDSAVLVAHMLRRGYEVHPLYIRSGLYWEKAEIQWLKRYMKSLGSPRLKPLAFADAPVGAVLGRHWSLDGRKVPQASSAWDSVYLPGRNLFLLSQAGLFCFLRGIPLIAQGLLKGNPFSDATPNFRRRMEGVLKAGLGVRVRIVAPYSGFTKARVVSLIDGLPLNLTFSCLRPRGLKHCGKCSKCEERLSVLKG